jgi:type II secretory pathway component PulM
MSPRLTSHKRILSICGPALCIALVYYFSLCSPLLRSLKAERTKLHKLEAASSRRANSESLAEKLAGAEADVRRLNEQINEAKLTGTHLVARRADLRSQHLQSNSPAMAVAETLLLLNQHGLECVSTSSVTDQTSSAPLTDSLKPVAVLLGETTNHTVESINRREMRIGLRGRFQDMQSALRELLAAPLGIFTVSLEMEDSSVHTDIRMWILTIAV